MAGLLYFASQFTAPVTLEALAALGLRQVFAAPPAHGRIDGRTPSGAAGTIFADLARLGGRDLAYCAERQTWLRRGPDDCLWLGYWTDARPTPADLARDKQLPGDLVELVRGEQWRIPRVLAFAGEQGFACDLPCYAARTADGQWTNGRVLDEYAPAARLAERLYAGMILAELDRAPRLTTAELLDATAELLAINYAVGPAELQLLEALPLDERLAEVARAAADWAAFEDWSEKKNAVASRSDSAG
ncbi:MAG TPA: hypothetical protein PJ982_15045 [Lacipirellulaceae bacterium]|nr:hypothetical protein [Lacipirellulaceae bacterium]